MATLYKEEGASLRVEVLKEEDVLDFIGTHADILDSTFSQTKMSDTLRHSLQRSNWIFSGMKTFHELHEAFPSLLDEEGKRKPFERFLKDVQRVDETYNKHYLRAEYNFATASAQAAAQWEQIEADADRYHLQYRTAGDDRVRDEHQKLEGITLPPSNSFWDTYYPPNGWNCRCRAVQVRKSKYPSTPSHEVIQRVTAHEAQQKGNKRDMFRFNSGKQKKVWPDYNPYTIRNCSSCPLAQGKGKMGLAFVPSNEACEGCAIVNACFLDEKKSKIGKMRKHYTYTLEKITNGMSVNKSIGDQQIKIKFFNQGINHLVNDIIQSRTKAIDLDDLLNIEELLKQSTYIGDDEYRKDKIKNATRMLYFVVEVRGKKATFNVAKIVERKKEKKIKVSYLLYSVSGVKKENPQGGN